MDTNQIIDELNNIFRNVLNNKDINLTPDTTAKDVAKWDSLSNIHLVVEIEAHFKVRFKTSEIQEWKNVGDLISSLQKKLNA